MTKDYQARRKLRIERIEAVAKEHPFELLHIRDWARLIEEKFGKTAGNLADVYTLAQYLRAVKGMVKYGNGYWEYRSPQPIKEIQKQPSQLTVLLDILKEIAESGQQV